MERKDRVGHADPATFAEPVPSARVDRWLWAVRVYKTRAAATEACRGGHVEVDGAAAKAATRIRPGCRVTARVQDRDRVVEVVDPISRRVGAAEAATCLVDHTPPAPPREQAPFVRERGSGRPTKRDRRRLDRFRG